MKRRTISIICRDVSGNSFGRAYILARLLSRDYDIHVIGPQFGKSIWPPVDGLLEKHGVRVTSVPAINAYPQFLRAIPSILSLIGADIVYALKPFPTSYGLGLLYHFRNNIPLVLDIDDWEIGTYKSMNSKELSKIIFKTYRSPNNYFWLNMLYNFTDKATAITVSSNFLQKKYGGTIIPHARDTDIMKPDSVNVNEVRTRFGLHGKIIMFLGTIRPHKGVEDLIAAVMRINRPDVYCVIVGAEQNDVYVQQLVSHSNERIRFIPPQSFEKIPELLASADIIVIPQRDSLFSQAQLPAKLFDGMAMARPIVATAVSDIPSILDKCGVIVPPGDVEALALALTELLDDPTQATALGLAAREKCIREYGWNAVSDKLCKVIEGL